MSVRIAERVCAGRTMRVRQSDTPLLPGVRGTRADSDKGLKQFPLGFQIGPNQIRAFGARFVK